MPNIDLDYAVQRHHAGTDLKNLAKELGVSRKYLDSLFRRNGIHVVNHRPRVQIDVSQLVQMFQEGMSTKALAEHFGCSRRAIDERLIKAGLTPRTASESMYLRMQQATPEVRRQLTEAAHAAVRGKRHTLEQKCRKAVFNQSAALARPLTGHELAFWSLWQGPPLVRQFAVGPYNVDFLVTGTTVTVEMFGGAWHAHGRHLARFRERAECIRDAGYTSIIVWCLFGEPPTARCAKYVDARVKEFHGDKSVLREQYVITSRGQPTTFGSDKLEYFACVPGCHQ